MFIFLIAAADAAEPVPANDSLHHASPAAANSNDAVLEGPELAAAPSWSEALRAVLLTAIPDQYEDLKHWGKTTRVFDGFRMKQRGFDIRIKDQRRTVNHGAWQRYTIRLLNPKTYLKFVIDDIHPTELNKFQFTVRLASKLRCRGDFENWWFGVKGFNMTIVSDADVQIVALCQLTIRTEPNRRSVLPDLILEPRVNAVSIALSNLDVQRIGEIRGDLAEGIGDASRRFIENLLKAQEGRVVKKANEAIDKKRGNLRIPAIVF